MSTLEDLAQRVEHLLVRHAELQRTHALLEAQLAGVTAERDTFKARLQAARVRLDGLLAKIPAASETAPTPEPEGDA